MTRKVWLLALAAVAVRAAGALTVAVVAPDGSRYLRMARLMLEGKFGAALDVNPMHPLFPLLIALGDALIGNPLVAGAAVSAILGGLALIPLYAISRAVWDDRVATVAGMLYVFLPPVAILHGEVMTEGTFHFFFFSSMALAWSALERKSWERAVLAGACTGLAWLARPEGIYLLPLFLLAALFHRHRFTPAALGLALAAAFLLAYPYLAAVKARTGGWNVSAHPNSQWVMGVLTGRRAASGWDVNVPHAEEHEDFRYILRFGKVGGPALYILKTLAKDMFYVLVPFALAGFFFFRPEPGRWGPALYLLAAAGGYVVPSILSFFAASSFGYRWLLPTAILLLPFADTGIPKAAERVRRPAALPVLLSVLSLAMLVKVLDSKREEKRGLKDAGLAIRARLGPDRRMAGMSRQVEHYAQGDFLELPGDLAFVRLEKLVEERKIEVLPFYVRDLRHLEPGFVEKLDRRYALLGEFPAPPEKGVNPVRIYLASPP